MIDQIFPIQEMFGFVDWLKINHTTTRMNHKSPRIILTAQQEEQIHQVFKALEDKRDKGNMKNQNLVEAFLRLGLNYNTTHEDLTECYISYEDFHTIVAE